MADDESSPFLEDVSANDFDSHLEIPTSGDPNHNATLTIILRYRLQFADSKNRVPGVIVNREGTPRALDGEFFAHYIKDWDHQSRCKFTRAMYLSEKIWTYKFMLIPPRSYNGLDFPIDPYSSNYVRPNVMCALRMEPWGDPHITITVVRVTDPMPFANNTNRSPPRNMVLEETAPQTPVLGHELGHALGMLHIKVLLGDRACRIDGNADRCYGETPHELANIMGVGRDLWPLNAAPWIDRIALHTNTKKAEWRATMSMKMWPKRLTSLQHRNLEMIF